MCSDNSGSYWYAYLSSYSNSISGQGKSACIFSLRTWTLKLLILLFISYWLGNFFRGYIRGFPTSLWLSGENSEDYQDIHFRSMATAVAPVATDFPGFLFRTMNLRSLNAPLRDEIHRREPWKPKVVIQKYPWEEILSIPPLSLCPGW